MLMVASVDMTGNGDVRYFHNLLPNEQQEILNYKLTIYVCEGSEGEKLEWFKIINIAGEKLTLKSCATQYTPAHGWGMRSCSSRRPIA